MQLLPLEVLAVAMGHIVVKYLRATGELTPARPVPTTPAPELALVTSPLPASPDTKSPASPPSDQRPAHSLKPPVPKSYIADEANLTPIKNIPWDSHQMRSVLAVALETERLTKEGIFAVVWKRRGGPVDVSVKRCVALEEREEVLFTVQAHETAEDGRIWLTQDHAGHDVRRILPDGRTVLTAKETGNA